MPGPKPKLEVATPLTSNFPSEIASATSVSTATPLSSLSLPAIRCCKAEPEFIKTPITPPPAYTDFLSRAMAFTSHPVDSAKTTARESSPPESPPATDKNDKPDDSSASSTASTASTSAKDEQSPSTSPTTSASSTSKPSSPSSATTLSASERASAVERALASASASLVPPSPFTKGPMSAPLTGPTSFPSFKIPPSPALSNLDSPLSAAASMFSPFSGRSSRSVFDWDAALKARCADQKKSKSARTVRHIREVVTRTVTYTPRMEPAPRGKRRKVE